MSSGFQDWMQFHVSWIRRNTLRLLWHVVAFGFHLVPFGHLVPLGLLGAMHLRRNMLRLLWHVVAFEFHLVPFGSIWFVGRNASECHLVENAPAVGMAGAIIGAARCAARSFFVSKELKGVKTT